MLMLNMLYFVVLLRGKNSRLDVEANFIERGDRRQTALPAHLHK